jgi:hypothetical protein
MHNRDDLSLAYSPCLALLNRKEPCSNATVGDDDDGRSIADCVLLGIRWRQCLDVDELSRELRGCSASARYEQACNNKHNANGS